MAQKEQRLYHQPQRRTGRKMHVGTLAWDEKKNIRGIFIGYCPNCQYKVVTPEGEAAKLVSRYCRDKRSYLVRLIKHLLKLRSV